MIYDPDGTIKSRSVANIKSAREFKENTNKYYFEGTQTDLAKNLYNVQE